MNRILLKKNIKISVKPILPIKKAPKMIKMIQNKKKNDLNENNHI